MAASKNLVAASSTPIVLAILAHGESYGYAILKQVNQRSGGSLEWSEGMLYPVLHRLQQQRLIKAQWRVGDSGRRRKCYQITDKGRKALVAEREQWTVVQRTLTKLWKDLPCPA